MKLTSVNKLRQEPTSVKCTTHIHSNNLDNMLSVLHMSTTHPENTDNTQ